VLKPGALILNATLALQIALTSYTFPLSELFSDKPLPHFASFWDARLFHRPVAEIGSEEFAEYVERYNIGWMVLHHEEANAGSRACRESSCWKNSTDCSCFA